MNKNLRWALFGVVLILFGIAPLLRLPPPAHATTTNLIGTIKDAQGNGVNGTLVLQLAVSAKDTTTNTFIIPRPIVYQLINGVIQGGTTVPIQDNASMSPDGDYYTAKVYDSAGALIAQANYVVPAGASFNLGAAVPTSITTSNISYVSPVLANQSNNFTVAQTFARIISGTTNPAAAGWISMANLDAINIRNFANTADLNVFSFSGATTMSFGDASGSNTTQLNSAVFIPNGNIYLGSSGTSQVLAGPQTGAAAGVNLLLAAGTATAAGNPGRTVTLQGSNATGNTSQPGGAITISAGAGAGPNGLGGSIAITPGTGLGTGAGTGTIQLGTGFNCPILVKTAAYTLLAADCIIQASVSGGSFTLTLPHLATGQVWQITRTDTSANVLTIQPDSGLINNAASTTFAVSTTHLVHCDGTNCWSN